MIFMETDRIMSALTDVSICIFYIFRRASLVAQMVKNLPTRWETWVRSLGRKDPLETGMANPLQYSGLENPTERED